jgi:APA family basic amino acid/polyamine antiporter
MVLKIVAIGALIILGFWFAPAKAPAAGTTGPTGFGLDAIGAAMTAVMFSYGGWQTSSFVAGEMRNPQRDLARGLLLGVAGVAILYTAVAFVCVHALDRRARPIQDPASDVMRLALGEKANLHAIGIAISALDPFSQECLPHLVSISPWRKTACSSARY